MLRATALAAAAASAVAFHPGAPAQQPFRRPPLAATVERELAASLPASAMEAVPDMVECPFTKWGEPIADVAAEKAGLAPLPAFPLVRGGPTDAAVAGSAVAELAWVRAHREELRAQIKEHGAVHLKGLELTKESEGFQQVRVHGRCAATLLRTNTHAPVLLLLLPRCPLYCYSRPPRSRTHTFSLHLSVSCSSTTPWASSRAWTL